MTDIVIVDWIVKESQKNGVSSSVEQSRVKMPPWELVVDVPVLKLLKKGLLLGLYRVRVGCLKSVLVVVIQPQHRPSYFAGECFLDYVKRKGFKRLELVESQILLRQ